MTRRIMRLPEVKETTGLSKTNIYYKVKRGEFPQPIPLGGRAIGWFDTDIQQWLEECASQRQPA